MLECVLAIEKWILITAVKWKEEIRKRIQRRPYQATQQWILKKRAKEVNGKVISEEKAGQKFQIRSENYYRSKNQSFEENVTNFVKCELGITTEYLIRNHK